MRFHALAPSILILAGGLAAAATQDPVQRPRSPEEVVITATPLGGTRLETAQPATVLEGPRLLRERAMSLGDTLAGQPGVEATFFGPQASRPVIRGQGGERVQVYLDGVDALDVSALSDDHAVSIDPLLAERIEIIRGPATLLYGNSAAAGLVNVITPRIAERADNDPFRAAAELRANSATDERAAAATARFGDARWRFSGDVFRRRTDDLDIPRFALSRELRDARAAAGEEVDLDRGRLKNSDSDARGAGVGVSRVGERGYLGFALSGFETNYGIPGPKEEEEADGGVRIDLQQRRADLAGEWRSPETFLTRLRLQAGYSDYDHRELEPDGSTGSEFLQQGLEARVTAEHAPVAGFRGVFGVQHRRLDFEALGEEAFVPPSVTRNVGVFAFEKRRLGPVVLEAGVRLDRQQVDPELAGARRYVEDAVSGSLGGLWNLSRRWQLAAHLTSTQRHPTATELYADGPHLAVLRYEIGDETLGRERARTLDLALRTLRGDWTFTLSAFVADYDGYIFLLRTGDQEDGLPVVQFTAAEARFRGGELELASPAWTTAVGALSVRLFGDWVRAEDDAGDPLPLIPPLRVGSELRLERGALGLGLTALWLDRQDRVSPAELPTPSATLLSADVNWRPRARAPDLSLFLRGSNLLDEDVRRHSSPLKDYAPLPGRALSAGIRVNF